MDNLDKKLLNLLQTDFPLAGAPFAVLGARLGISEDEAIRRTKTLKERGIIRQIAAIFDSTALGHRSSLVAFSVPDDRVEEVAGIVNAHPGVSHNYERTHAYNLWFTITVPPGTALEAEVDRLAAQARPRAVRMFPTVRLLKIGVAFDMTGTDRSGTPRPNAPGRSEPIEIDQEDVRAIRALQRDLPIERRPFATLAQGVGMSEAELIARARALAEVGAMRRYAAVLRHREAGFAANAMAVWAVPEDRVEEAGRKMAAHPAVSHCYQRTTYPDWPYSVFTMIHGRSPRDCEKAARELSDAAGITDYLLLYSTREFKKTSVQYYEHEDR